MKKISTIFLQVVVVIVGVVVLAFMLWEPHIEGRNINATLFQIYFNDPFLICAYIASVPFFVALWQVIKTLRYIGQNKIFSQSAVKSLQTIKYCAVTLVGFAVMAEAYLFIVRPGDDIAGGVFMGLLMIFIFGVVVTIVGIFERILQNAIDIMSINKTHP